MSKAVSVASDGKLITEYAIAAGACAHKAKLLPDEAVGNAVSQRCSL